MPEIEIQMHKRKKVVGNTWRIQQGLGLKDFESARRTIAGIEIVHMLKKNQLNRTGFN